ncbi:DUF2868 domain-containing protein [Phragmitibacter flavus]|uniref:DUF2868 domain-containing protein n=1 Tax=Phragmitibacter flavus TaxID=2576071 RepID=A0A5R8KBQ4_9BACT|nr:DUF2868 domain-containing protein [Phragmitibacter flavus]TLD69731.1 DUF2868 domain-containing protein [Phragmitibacter flavus]
MWHQLLKTSHVRAVEETDRENHIWPQETRRAATQQTRNEFPNIALPKFLTERSRILLEKPSAKPVPPQLDLPRIPSWLGFNGWIAAIIVGWFLAALGQESEINLLALPLIGLLLWNGIVMLLSLISGGKSTAPDAVANYLIQRARAHQSPISTRFIELIQRPWLQRFTYRFRAWLHIAAALLALGSISGMYARGWSKEYRAVWESTLLNDQSATTFFNTLFQPASQLLNIPVPTSDIRAMRRGINLTARQPAAALPWIHLYAGTLALFIILPRGLLALLEWQRSRQAIARALQTEDWQNYATRLLALTDGSGSAVQILVHGFISTDRESQDRWRLIAHRQWPDMGHCQFEQVTVGNEVAFIESWNPPASSTVLLIFNLAAVPEIEIHRWLAESILEKWRTVKSHPSLIVALDDSALSKRWSSFGDYPQRLDQRRQNWSQILEGLPIEIVSDRNVHIQP